jgi:hypothetical protein
MVININQLASFAFKNHCSYFGGKPYSNVLHGEQSQLYFFFNPKYKNNYFYMWVRSNFDSRQYHETTLIYKHSAYSVITLKTQMEVNKKFLFSFKRFTSISKHLVSYL